MEELWLSTEVVKPANGITFAVVTVGGELDLFSAPVLREHLQLVLSQLGPCIALDLHDLRFMDSSGLSLLVHFWKLTAAAGGTIHLLAPSRHIVRKLHITGLDSRIKSFSHMEELLAAPLGEKEP